MAVDPKKLQEIKDLLDQIQNQYNRLGEKNPFKGIDPNKVKDADAEIKKLQAGLDGVESRVRKIDTTFNDLGGTLKSIVNEINPKALNSTKLLEKGMKGLVTQANRLALEEDDIGSLSKQQLTTIKERALASQKMAKDNAADLLREMGIRTKDGKVQEKDGLKIGRMRAEDREKAKSALGILKDQNNIQKDLLDKINDRIGLEDEFNKKLGFGGKLAGGLDKALQKAGLPALGISEAIGQTRKEFLEAQASGDKTAKSFSVMGNLAKNLGGSLKKSLSSANLMQGAFAFLVKALISVDKDSGEFAKNQGISYQRTVEIRGEMSKIAKNSKDILVTSKALMETQASLNKFFGQSTLFSGKLAEDMTSIAKRTKMSEETQGLFALESLKTGKSTKDLLKSQQMQTLEQNKQKGLNLSFKQVQDAIGKTSNSLQLTFKGSTNELVKQVFEAKKLGSNLSQVEQISSSLLDFESSIQSELEAELLLGKNINLEKARQFALQGDLGKVAKEIGKQEAIMSAFRTKNVIAQQAAAKALGLSRDELANMVMEQEKMNALSKNLKREVTSMSDAQEYYNELRADGLSAEQAAEKINDKNLAKQLESASVAERFEATMLRVQEIFVGMATPVLALVDGMMTFAGGAERLANILIGIAATYTLIKGIQAATRGYQAASLIFAKMRKKEEERILAIKAGQATAQSIINPVAAVAGLAIAATVGALIYGAIKGNDVLSPGKDMAGYGNRVLLGPEGAISLNNKDTVIAGTDLFKADDVAVGPPDSIQNIEQLAKSEEPKNEIVQQNTPSNAELIAKVEQLIRINTRIAEVAGNRKQDKITVEMMGDKVGDGIVKQSYGIN